MKTFLLALLLFFGLAKTQAAETYAILKVTFTTKKVADRAYDDVASYYWKTIDGAKAGNLTKIGGELGIDTDTKGGFTEFHLVSGILKNGWSLRGVSATPPHVAKVDGLEFIREGKKVYHFTKEDSKPTEP